MDPITRDLAHKVSDDVGHAIRRTMQIAPEVLPVAVFGAVSAITTLAAAIDHLGDHPAEYPGPDTVLLASLITARFMGAGRDGSVEAALAQAYADLERLKAS